MALDRNIVRWFRSLSYITLASICLFLVSSQVVFGQVDEGSITGTVQDSSGAVVAKAHVTLLNTDQGISLETDTNGSGSYTFSPVRIGHYSVTVTAAGFAKTDQQNLVVNVAQNLQVNVQLKAGAATETVEVTDAPPVLQTEDASVGQVVDAKSVNNLPLNGRNFTFLAQIGAGVNTPQADGRGNAASGAFTANGLRPAQNNYLLDGIDNNSNAVDFLNGTNFIVLPPVDAIEEFKVQTADFSAQTGRAGGAVLNATIKSGTNSLHGAAWEFLRNDLFDAADFFEPIKGKLRQNQFGASAGGPIIKNKVFFFGDYEGFRKIQGQTQTGSVPTAGEVASQYTDLSDIVRLQSGIRQDDLGRNIPYGTVTDPATTRLVKGGAVDPVSGLTNIRSSDTYVRDPVSAVCPASTTTYSLAQCADLNNLNVLGAGRVDPRSQKLLTLYPAPNANSTSVQNNFKNDSPITENRNAFDVRGDINPTQKDQLFVRFSYVDDPIFFPGIFGGVADGGFFGQGPQSAKSSQTAASFNHVFTPSTTNQARLGFNHLHTTRFGPLANQDGIPDTYGIKGIQQGSENGGLPTIGIGGLNQIGSSNFLPSDEISQTLQLTDDFTKIYGNHSFKAGIEYQHVKFSTLQPGWSRGQYGYDGNYVDVPTLSTSNTGIAQLLIPASAAPATIGGSPNPNGISYAGGADSAYASNINKTYDARNYFGAYLQDDWKVTPKLTLNLGVRYDYFGPIAETNGGQANFVPAGTGPFSKSTILIPKSGKDKRGVSTFQSTDGLATNYTDFLHSLGIDILYTDQYGQGLVQTQKDNFSPRIGFAYQVTPRFVTRGGFGLAFNSFENQGYGPNIGENYPFVFNLSYFPSGAGGGNVQPVRAGTPFANCPDAGPGGTASVYTAFQCVKLDSTKLDAQGLGLAGMQFYYKTPRNLSANYTLQYSLTHTLAIQTAYVLTHVDNLQVNLNNNSTNTLLGPNDDTTNAKPFPNLGNGAYTQSIGTSTYNGLQTTLQQQTFHGLNYLITYTWSKTLTDAGDLLNGGATSGARAPGIPALGIKFDRSLAPFDVRNVFHISGGYELPFGKGKTFLGQSNRLADLVIGGWSLNWNAALQGGQPQTIGCGYGGTTDVGCYALPVKGQSQDRGEKLTKNGTFYYGNRLAFTQPCKLGHAADGSLVPIPDSPEPGCVALAGYGALGGNPSSIEGPSYHKVDLSLFKGFKISERFSTQFRAEFFNIFNHPNFSAPSNTNISDQTNFGLVTSTRDNPYGARQLQLALKLYY